MSEGHHPLTGSVRCIWCGAADPDAPPEHVLPAALGCPDEWTLRGGAVCEACNNGLSPLDQVLADELDLVAFVSGFPRRGALPPRFSRRGNVLGRYEDGRPWLYVNAERHAVDGGDFHLSGAGASRRSMEVVFDANAGPPQRFSLRFRMFESPRLVVALHKVAFSVLALIAGDAACRSDRFDAVREFVLTADRRARLDSRGRRVLMRDDPSPPSLRLEDAWRVPGGPFELATFRLIRASFSVDLSPAQEHTDKLIEQATRVFGADGWGVLPPPPKPT